MKLGRKRGKIQKHIFKIKKYNCLAIMTIVMFGGKRAEEHHRSIML
jgi:hypothetical protein